MDKREQREFLESFLASMQNHLVSMVANMPDDWNGIELRQYCADEFAHEVHKMDRRRMRAYRNAVATTPL